MIKKHPNTNSQKATKIELIKPQKDQYKTSIKNPYNVRESNINIEVLIIAHVRTSLTLFKLNPPHLHHNKTNRKTLTLI
jgi:hypothetical protein